MIVFLSGPKDAGKSTTAALLTQMDERIAVVEPDVFFEFLPSSMPLFDKAARCEMLSARCAEALHHEGFIVVIAYPITDVSYARYREHLVNVPDEELRYITLAPKKERLFARTGLDTNDSNDARYRRDVITEQYEGESWGTGVVEPNYPAHILDTSHLEPAEVAREVYRIIREN